MSFSQLVQSKSPENVAPPKDIVAAERDAANAGVVKANLAARRPGEARAARARRTKLRAVKQDAAARDDEFGLANSSLSSHAGASQSAEAVSKARRSPMRAISIVLAICVAVALAYSGGKYYVDSQGVVGTDDAFIAADIVRLSPQTAGRVIDVPVDDNARVEAGQVLVRIDPDPAATAVHQAQGARDGAVAQLAQARSQVEMARANAQVAELTVRGQEIAASAGNKQLARVLALKKLSSGSVSDQQIDEAREAAESAETRLAAARQQSVAALAQLDVAQHTVELAAAQIDGAQAQLDQARQNLSYTEIKAPISGHIARKSVAVGNLVQPGQDLMAIVPLRLYVTANLKETQLASVRVGDPVDVKVDAYPEKIFRGHVDSMQFGAGEAFALLPTENATGNFIKVTQRVPVKILLDEPSDPHQPLGPGMSAQPYINVSAR